MYTFAGITYLIAPAAVLGPNHCPTSFLNSFPARAILCTENGACGAGVSKNHVSNLTYVANSGVCSGYAGTLHSMALHQFSVYLRNIEVKSHTSS